MLCSAVPKNKNCKTCKCWQGVDNYAYKFPTIKDVMILSAAQTNLISYIIINNLEVGKTAQLHRDRFLHALFNSARVSFIGSCSAQVTVQVMHNGKESYINASYQVMNTTSLESLTAGILPDLEYDGPMGNWTQTYIWEERFSCCEDRTRQQIEMENLMMNMMNGFPYNLYGNENIPLPTNYFFFMVIDLLKLI